jgi:hypothetical protein
MHPAQASVVFIPPSVPMVQVTPPAPTFVSDPPSPSPTLTSGITGQVRLGPLHPTSTAGEPNDEPLAGARIIISKVNSWQRAITVVSDANGNFTIALAPGDYVLTPQPLHPGQTFPHTPRPQTVHVSANMFTTVTFEYDTGIR